MTGALTTVVVLGRGTHVHHAVADGLRFLGTETRDGSDNVIVRYALGPA